MKFPTFLSLTGLLLLLPTSTFALPQQSSKQSTPAKHYNNNNKSKCTAPVKRVEWRQMRPADQQSYLDSVLCLKTKPSRIGLNSSTLYDDFAYVHFNLSKQIHGCAAFLPWHRYFTLVYEGALRGECGYKGPMTFWDWTQDNLKLLESPVMAAKLGFGGQASSTRTETLRSGSKIKCVDEGPFKNLRPNWIAFSPNEVVQQEHCFFRDVIDGPNNRDAVAMAPAYTAENIRKIQDEEEFYETFEQQLEGSPHGVIHASLGGEMNPTTSPNEPLFFLHHPQIDRIWWQWQQKNITERQDQYFGTKLDAYGFREGPASLNDVLKMNGLAPDITVREIMNTADPRWCYTY